MNQIVTHLLCLDHQRQAVFRVALAQQVQSVLVASEDYGYVVRAIDLCWSWIERHDVDGMALYYLFHDDEDYGVEPAMSVEHDPVMWNAWACVAEALAYTGSCAFEFEGTPPPETFENAFPDELVAEFLSYYHAVVGESRIPELLVAFLKDLPDDQLTRSVVCAKLGELSAHAQDEQ